MSSTFVVVQGPIVKMQLYEVEGPKGRGRMPAGRLKFEVQGANGREKEYVPVAIRGDMVPTAQAFLETAQDGAPQALAYGHLCMREGRAEVHAHRLSFLVPDEMQARAVALLRRQQRAVRGGGRNGRGKSWKSS